MPTHAAPKKSTSHASKPFFGSQLARSAAFFSSSPTIQAKLTVGEPGDRFEREADAVADTVVQRKASRSGERGSVPSVQAKCAKCAHEDTAQRQVDGDATSGASDHAADSVQKGIAAQSGAGQALATPLRQEMEQDIGADFSGVRIHTGAPAANLNDTLHARAFTHDQDVFFNSGQFDPGSSAGRHLLAHELTHVVQQSGGAPNIQRDDAGGGSTEFSDKVTSKNPASGTSPVISGTVTRTETAPASGKLPRQVVSTGTMNVEFNPKTCEVTIPFRYKFVQAAAAAAGPCDAGPNHALMAPDAFNALKASVLNSINSGLNGWFDVKLSGKACPAGCADKLMPIRVVATENDATFDTTVTVVNRKGRSDSGTVCALSWGGSTADHEGAHQVLGVGDEYPEQDEKFRATSPEWFRKERIRRDYSKMGPGLHSRFAMFHERHFAAVTAFLQDIYPGCTATLVARSRSIIPDYRLSSSFGYASLNGVPGLFARAGLDIGIPLDRMRRWSVILGPEFTVLTTKEDLDSQRAFLFGARLGLEGATGLSGSGLTGGAFVSGGYGLYHSTNLLPGNFLVRDARGGYGEVSARFGYRTQFDGGPRFNFGLEGAAGTSFGAKGDLGPEGPNVGTDPRHMYWFRLGIGATLQL